MLRGLVVVLSLFYFGTNLLLLRTSRHVAEREGVTLHLSHHFEGREKFYGFHHPAAYLFFGIPLWWIATVSEWGAKLKPHDRGVWAMLPLSIAAFCILLIAHGYGIASIPILVASLITLAALVL